MRTEIQLFKIFASCLIFIIMSNPAICQSHSAFWLSGKPPEQIQSKLKTIGMQRYYGIPGRPGNEKFVLWLCQGISPDNMQYLESTLTSDTEIITYNSNNEKINYSLENGPMGYALIYEFGEEGYNNIFMIDRFVSDSVLYISVAKAERISHKCMNGHKRIKQLVELKEYPEIPFQIYRKRDRKGENLHQQLQSGQKVSFIVKQKHAESRNTNVKFVSNKGWQMKKITDENGEVTFQIIQDYFSNLQELNQKYMSWYVVIASIEFDSTGTYQDKRFDKVFMETTFSGEYIPSELLYKSKYFAFMAIIIGIILVIVIIYYYRKKKPNYILN